MIVYTAGDVYDPRALREVEQFTFPGGEVGVKLSSSVRGLKTLTIKAWLKNSEDVMALLMTVDAMRRQNSLVDINLILAYVPYARQDRVCNDGEALSISVFAQLINSCDFRVVIITDPHSDVTPALIKNSRICSQIAVFEQA